MGRRPVHLSDAELLLFADRELAWYRRTRVRRHLSDCDLCRLRATELERTLMSFVQLHQSAADLQMPGAPRVRASLKSELAKRSGAMHGVCPRVLQGAQLASSIRLAGICAALLILAGGIWRMRPFFPQRTAQDPAAVEAGSLPIRLLTPGATRSIAVEKLCSAQNDRPAAAVSRSVAKKVFQEYGLAHARPDAYEVDYLITPELGGANDIRNLWPEPYSSIVWNAHVKDELENRLHQLVCDDELDLPTAQKAIATNWIAAYKKYFGTDQPRSNSAPPQSSSNANAPRRVKTIALFLSGPTRDLDSFQILPR